MNKRVIKNLLICLMIVAVIGLAFYGICTLYNKTHWITVTIKDYKKYGVIEEPIIIKIHPGEKIEFPQLDYHTSHGWLHWEGYYGDAEKELVQFFSVHEKDRFYHSVTIYPWYCATDPYGGDTQGLVDYDYEYTP